MAVDSLCPLEKVSFRVFLHHHPDPESSVLILNVKIHFLPLFPNLLTHTKVTKVNRCCNAQKAYNFLYMSNKLNTDSPRIEQLFLSYYAPFFFTLDREKKTLL